MNCTVVCGVGVGVGVAVAFGVGVGVTGTTDHLLIKAILGYRIHLKKK